jgi:integrase
MLGPQNALMVKILLATCVRKGELILARREHLDLEGGTWRIPAENTKTRQGFVIPLAPAVAGWFRKLLESVGKSEFVLPSRIRTRRIEAGPIHERTLNAAIERLRGKVQEIGHFVPHDLRATARTHLAALGVDIIVAERCLNHSLGGLVAVYDKHDYMTERRRALELWANRIEELERDNVTSLRAAA